MKKTLFFSVLLAVSLSHAQVSFETSEGYTAGQSLLNNTNWHSLESNLSSTGSLARITNSKASHGTQSLEMGSNALYALAQDESTWPIVYTYLPNYSQMSISFDVQFSSSIAGFGQFGDYSDAFFSLAEGNDAVNPSTGGSSFELNIASSINFSYDNAVYFYDGAVDDFDFMDDSVTYNRNTWYNVTIEKNDTAVEYFINGVSKGTYALNSAVNTPNVLLFYHDNYGSAFYIDNMNVSETLGTTDFNANSFKVYPNPAQDEITIVLAHAQVLEAVKIYDMNGRMLKSYQANHINNTFNIADLTAGIYTLEVQSATGTASTQLIKN